MSTKKELRALTKGMDKQQKAFYRSATKAIADQARAQKLAVAQKMGVTPQAPTQQQPVAQSPSVNAPVDSAAPMTPRQQWQQLKAINPYAAAQFYSFNAHAIDSDPESWR